LALGILDGLSDKFFLVGLGIVALVTGQGDMLPNGGMLKDAVARRHMIENSSGFFQGLNQLADFARHACEKCMFCAANRSARTWVSSSV
jgi:hypothetical protein